MERKIYKKLAWLNELPNDEAIYVLTECSGSDAWARAMTVARPFPMLEHLYIVGAKLWIGDSFAETENRLNALLER